MNTRLYVGNLAFETMEQELIDLFKQVGTVANCSLVTDRYSGRSRGFAFIEMGSDADVEKAIKTLDGVELAGRNLRVNAARPREARTTRGGSTWQGALCDSSRGW